MNVTPQTILYVVLILILVIETVRSILHMVLPDGGSSSIAGLDTSGTDATNLNGMFCQWGTTQLVLVTLYWILIFRDRSYMTIIFGLLALEYILRLVAGWIKPLQTTKTPPGAALTYVAVPLSIILTGWSYYLSVV